MKKQNFLVLASLMAVAGALVGQAALASPIGSPSPDNNATNARFNSLSLINSAGKEYLKVKSMDPLGMHTVMESPDGYIYLNDSLAVTNGNLVVDRTIYANQSINSGDDIVAKGRLWSQGLNGYGGGMWLDLALKQFVGDASGVDGGWGKSIGFWINDAWRLAIDQYGALYNPSGNVIINDNLDIRGELSNESANSSVLVKDSMKITNGLTISGPSGDAVALEVAGRIRSGNGTNGALGGMWVNGPNGNSTQFVGSAGPTTVGFYNAPFWGLTLDNSGNVKIKKDINAEGKITGGALESAGAITAASNINSYANISALGDINGRNIIGTRFTGLCNINLTKNYLNNILNGGSTFDRVGCQDIAEIYQTSEKTEAGDILMLDTKNSLKMKLADRDSAGKLTGVVSTSAGVILSANGPVVSDGNNEDYINAEQTLLVLTGKAPVKVNNENGAIQVGDYITASSTPGVGMKANAGDQVVGIAMENFDSSKQGSILILSDKSGALSMVKDELTKKINSLEARLTQLEKLLVK